MDYIPKDLSYFKHRILQKAGALDDGIHTLHIEMFEWPGSSDTPRALKLDFQDQVLDKLPPSLQVIKSRVYRDKGNICVDITFTLKRCNNCSDVKHPAVICEHNGQTVSIDKELYPLIRQMWDAGIETLKSCQECPEGFFYIMLPGIEDFTKFMNIAYEMGTKYEHELEKEFPNAISTFYTEETGWSCELRSEDYPIRSPWQYTIEPHYTARSGNGEPPTLTLPVKMLIPIDEMHDLTVHFKKYNESRDFDEDD